MFWQKTLQKTVSRKKTRPVVTDVIQFQNHDVLIRRKPYKRSIGLTLQVNGRIRVSAPVQTPMKEIRDFLQKHVDWLETNAKRFSELRSAYPPKAYVEGEEFLYLGRRVKLHFEQGARRKTSCSVRGDELLVLLPSGDLPYGSEIIDAIDACYESEGRRILGDRLKYFSDRMELWPSAVSYRSQKTRWGSCSSRGRVSLNWRLAFAPPEIIDYVVVHELSHLKHYNHSARFWALVETQIPGALSKRNWLRVHQYEADFLAKRSELHE
jgi:predicted metal-dependent hydrolase